MKTNSSLLESTPMPEKLLWSVEDICHVLSIGKTCFYEMDTSGAFGPLPVPFGGRRKLYNVAEVRQWVSMGCPHRKIFQQMQGKKTA